MNPVMNVAYWDAIAPSYTSQVHDSLASDRRGVIARRLDAMAPKGRTVADFGCGVGGYTAALAARFKWVHALDHSERLLAQARSIHASLDNVEFRQADLSRGLRSWTPVDAGVCMNVLIMPDHKTRGAILRTIHGALKPGATLLIVVPSLESALYTDVRVVEWNMREGMSHRAACGRGLASEPGLVGPVAAGVVEVGGEPTKHYLREEAVVLLRRSGFDVRAVEKVEYSWRTEFERPPRWLGEPYPWDWLLTCARP